MNIREVRVAAIEHGTVIDHIQVGSGLAIVELLGLRSSRRRIAIGLNLPSQKLGAKDLIKIEDRELTPDEVNKISLVSPEARIAIIRDYQVVNKFQVALPDSIEGILSCPNPRCITAEEDCLGRFRLRQRTAGVEVSCHYCQSSFIQENSPAPCL